MCVLPELIMIAIVIHTSLPSRFSVSVSHDLHSLGPFTKELPSSLRDYRVFGLHLVLTLVHPIRANSRTQTHWNVNLILLSSQSAVFHVSTTTPHGLHHGMYMSKS